MFTYNRAFSSFAAHDLAEAKKFYGETLGIEIEDNGMGLWLKFVGGATAFVYPKADHSPSNYTILNFSVDNIDEAVEALQVKGITFEHYPEMTDEKGIARGLSRNQGPDIAWFKDPFGNFVSVMQEPK